MTNINEEQRNRRNQAVELIQSGCTLESVCKQLKMGGGTVKKACEEVGITVQIVTNRLSPEETEARHKRIIQLQNKGMPISKIMQIEGVSKATVIRAKHDQEKRDQIRAEKELAKQRHLENLRIECIKMWDERIERRLSGISEFEPLYDELEKCVNGQRSCRRIVAYEIIEQIKDNIANGRNYVYEHGEYEMENDLSEIYSQCRAKFESINAPNERYSIKQMKKLVNQSHTWDIVEWCDAILLADKSWCLYAYKRALRETYDDTAKLKKML